MNSIKNKLKKWFHTKDGIEQNEINKQLVVIVVSIFVTVISVIGVTYSAFVWSDNSLKNQSLTVGNVELDISTESTALGSNLNYPVPFDQESSLIPYTFTIKNTGTLASTYKLKIVADSAYTNTMDTQYIYMSLDGDKVINRTSLSSFGEYPIDQGALEPGESKTYDLRLWIIENAPNSVIGSEWHGKILLESTQAVPGKPNEPLLAKGMIPVVYNETDAVWEVADTSTTWYDYNTQMWANAVTVNETASTCADTSTCVDSVTKRDRSYYELNPGTRVSMDDVNTMWVWIPRFKYKITTGLGSSSELINPPQIDVVFESGTGSTGASEAVYRTGIADDGTNVNYYTHPAFRNGEKVYNTTAYDIGGWDKELTGIWVGKFETGGTADIPLIKPNISSLTNQNVSTQFVTSLKIAGSTMDGVTGIVTTNGNNYYGLLSGTDTHMMKNTEWGAVAYLSQSKYGKMGNSMYTGLNKEIYSNKTSYPSMVTGNSNGTPPANTKITQCAYNDITDRGNGTGACGAGASTTGTIYGVYDMVGGNMEYVMSNLDGYSGNTSASHSGFNGPINGGGTHESGISFPETKYYDKQTSKIIYDEEEYEDYILDLKSTAMLGDATWETINWYSDKDLDVYNNFQWFVRWDMDSGSSNPDPGIFAINMSSGTSFQWYSFYTVLIP